VALLVGGYVLALLVWGRRLATGTRRATTSHVVCFALGVGVLWLAVDWPVHALAEHLLSVHMVQHLVLSLVAAPLLLLGIPGWVLRRLLVHPRAVFAVARVATRPLPALLVFNTWVVVYHLPVVLDARVRSEPVHLAAHVVWVGAALLMWWPVLSPLPELPHLSYLLRLGYLFAQSVVPTVPASFLTFSGSALYASYTEAAPLWGLSAVADQQAAGLLMKVGGGLLIWAVILVLFFRWFTEEETGGPDLLYWRDVRGEIDTTAPES
jgi:putative membrane protein